MKLGFHDLHTEDLNILQLSEVWMLNNCFECKGISDLEKFMGYSYSKITVFCIKKMTSQFVSCTQSSDDFTE